MEIRLVDKDDLPLANFMEHQVSEEELYSDEKENSEEDSACMTADKEVEE